MSTRIMRNLITAVFLAVLTASCGGGGGGGAGAGGGNPGVGASSFTAIASAGELLTYTVDLNNLTYNYVITDSAYGLNGVTGSGTLISNGDGTYRPSGYNARIKILPNGILIGAIFENFGAGPEVVPIIGLDNPTSSISTLAGIYNFVLLGCDLTACGSNYGTFQININNTWQSCTAGNISVGGPCLVQRNGTLVSAGGGKWNVMEGASQVGTAIAQLSAGQEVLVIDLDDIAGIGRGIVVGATQTPITSTQANGTWDYNGYSFLGAYTSGYVVVNGPGGTDYQDGLAPAGFTLTLNSPWAGFARTGAGGHGILAGNGVYAYELGSFAYGSIGIKR